MCIRDRSNNWGIRQYTDIVLQDERGIDCLRLWFTIEGSMERPASAERPRPTPTPTPTPTPSPISQQFYLVAMQGIQIACPSGWEPTRGSEAVYIVSKNDTTIISVLVMPAFSKERYEGMVADGNFTRTTVGGYAAYKSETTTKIYDKYAELKQFIIVEGDKSCVILFTCDVDKLRDYEPVFEYVLDSFKFR